MSILSKNVYLSIYLKEKKNCFDTQKIKKIFKCVLAKHLAPLHVHSGGKKIIRPGDNEMTEMFQMFFVGKTLQKTTY